MKVGWKNSGTTMPELLVTLVLVAMVSSGLMAVYWTGSRIFHRQSANVDTQYAVRSAMRKMGTDVLEAISVDIAPKGTELALITGYNEKISYYIQNHNLYREGASKTPVAENISYLYFSGNRQLVEISLEATTGGRNFRLSSKFHPRTLDSSGTIVD